MTDVLVDSNVILDIVTEDANWFEWSSTQLIQSANRGNLIINAEVSIGFAGVEALESALPPDFFQYEPLPWNAAFLAGKAFLQYRRRGGDRRSPLPDFYIGAQYLASIPEDNNWRTKQAISFPLKTGCCTSMIKKSFHLKPKLRRIRHGATHPS